MGAETRGSMEAMLAEASRTGCAAIAMAFMFLARSIRGAVLSGGDGGFACASYRFGRGLLLTRVDMRMAIGSPVMLRAKLEVMPLDNQFCWILLRVTPGPKLLFYSRTSPAQPKSHAVPENYARQSGPIICGGVHEPCTANWTHRSCTPLFPFPGRTPGGPVPPAQMTGVENYCSGWQERCGP